MNLNKETEILIVGLGLIGGSYAKALSAKGYTVHGIDTNKKAVDFALKHGYIKCGFTEPSKENVGSADIIIMALYPNALIKWMEKYSRLISSDTLVTDVTGIKQCAVYKIQKMLDGKAEFIGAHPMAGREKSGIENADESIFKDANYIVTPTEKNTPEAIKICKQLGVALGFARVSELNPEEHDKMIAYLSQLAHILAVSLMTAVSDERICDYTGDSFRDLTRIARLNENMWSELFILNKEALLEEMTKFEKEFDRMKEYIQNDNIDAIKEMMILSTERRALFDKRNLRKKGE